MAYHGDGRRLLYGHRQIRRKTPSYHGVESWVVFLLKKRLLVSFYNDVKSCGCVFRFRETIHQNKVTIRGFCDYQLMNGEKCGKNGVAFRFDREI